MCIKLEIWFEFASTYSYLTVCRAERTLREANLEFVWRPFLLGPILLDKGVATSPFVLDEAKGNYMWRDVARRAGGLGLAFHKPTAFPMNGLKAARIMTAAESEPWNSSFARSVFHKQFAQGYDISETETLRNALLEVGADTDYWIERSEHADTKSALRARTDQAKALGIFGAPSFIVGRELFWGDDRLEDAIDYALKEG